MNILKFMVGMGILLTQFMLVVKFVPLKFPFELVYMSSMFVLVYGAIFLVDHVVSA